MNPRSQSPDTISPVCPFFMGRKVQLAGRRGCHKPPWASAPAPGQAQGHSWPGGMGCSQGLETPRQAGPHSIQAKFSACAGHPFRGCGCQANNIFLMPFSITVFILVVIFFMLCGNMYLLALRWDQNTSSVENLEEKVSLVLKIIKLYGLFSFFNW